MPLSATATSWGANDALRAPRCRRTRPLTSARRGRQDEACGERGLTGPAGRHDDAVGRGLGRDLVGLREGGGVGEVSVDRGHPGGAGERGHRRRDRVGEQVGALGGRHPGQGPERRRGHDSGPGEVRTTDRAARHVRGRTRVAGSRRDPARSRWCARQHPGEDERVIGIGQLHSVVMGTPDPVGHPFSLVWDA